MAVVAAVAGADRAAGTGRRPGRRPDRRNTRPTVSSVGRSQVATPSGLAPPSKHSCRGDRRRSRWGVLHSSRRPSLLAAEAAVGVPVLGQAAAEVAGKRRHGQVHFLKELAPGDQLGRGAAQAAPRSSESTTARKTVSPLASVTSTRVNPFRRCEQGASWGRGKLTVTDDVDRHVFVVAVAVDAARRPDDRPVDPHVVCDADQPDAVGHHVGGLVAGRGVQAAR